MRKIIKAAVNEQPFTLNQWINVAYDKLQECIDILTQFDIGGMMDSKPEEVYDQVDEIYYAVKRLNDLR
jgi:hypothetical protein